MTNKELIEVLKKFPEDASLVILEYEYYTNDSRCWDKKHKNFRDYDDWDLEGIYYHKEKNEIGFSTSKDLDKLPNI